MQVFVIALGRAGEDQKSFKINDVESTFQGFAGADYRIQVCRYYASQHVWMQAHRPQYSLTVHMVAHIGCIDYC